MSKALQGAIGIIVGAIITAVAVFVPGAQWLLPVGIGLIAGGVMGLLTPPQPKPSDIQQVIKASAAPRFRLYGRGKEGGVLCFAETQQGYLHRVFAMGSGEIDAVEEHWIDDNVVEVDGSGNVTTPLYDGLVAIEYRIGDGDPEPYANLVAEFPTKWTNDHLGKGVPHAYMRMKQVKAEKLTQVYPRVSETLYRQVRRGAKLFDPNDPGHDIDDPATWTWSDNAARVILDFLIHPDGMRLSTEWITNAIEYWQEAAAVCDEDVSLKAGGTEKRWRIWNTYNFAERPADVLARLLQACDAMLFPIPSGGIGIKVGKWEAPTVTIDDDAIIGIADIGRGRDALTTANVIRAQFTSPFHDYKETDADPWIDEDDVAVRGEISNDMQFFAVPSHAQCRRLMKIAAHRANPQWVATLICNLRGLPVLGERFIRVTSAEFGIDEDFEVTAPPDFIIKEGNILAGVQIAVASLSSAAYAWDAVAEEGTAPEIVETTDNNNTLPVPENFEVEVEHRFVGPGRVAIAILTWDQPVEDYFEVEVRGKRVTDTLWFTVPVLAGALTAEYGPMQDGVAYEFEARTVSVTGRVSDWVDSDPPTIVADADPNSPRLDFSLVNNSQFIALLEDI